MYNCRSVTLTCKGLLTIIPWDPLFPFVPVSPVEPFEPWEHKTCFAHKMTNASPQHKELWICVNKYNYSISISVNILLMQV